LVLKLIERITGNIHEGNIILEPRHRPPQRISWQWTLNRAITQ
jgi:hypothetical protein